jgi:hypothetical protein
MNLGSKPAKQNNPNIIKKFPSSGKFVFVKHNLTNENHLFFFKTPSNQLCFEFFYLIGILILSCIFLLIIHNDFLITFSQESKWYLYAALGGLLGGWAYDVKWFYRVIGRGKNNQHPWKYERSKFFWRIFVPLLSAVTGISFFALVISDIFPLITIKNISGASAYSFSFVTGYFSDIVYSKLANWFENILGSKEGKSEL